MSVLEILTWAKRILSYDSKARLEIKQEVVDSLRQVSIHGEGSKDKKAGKKLADSLSAKADWRFVGFVPNTMYIKADAKDKKDLKHLYVHAWGTETLLFIHKKLPILIITNPGIRIDNTVLHEMRISKDLARQILGLSS